MLTRTRWTARPTAMDVSDAVTPPSKKGANEAALTPPRRRKAVRRRRGNDDVYGEEEEELDDSSIPFPPSPQRPILPGLEEAFLQETGTLPSRSRALSPKSVCSIVL